MQVMHASAHDTWCLALDVQWFETTGFAVPGIKHIKESVTEGKICFLSELNSSVQCMQLLQSKAAQGVPTNSEVGSSHAAGLYSGFSPSYGYVHDLEPAGMCVQADDEKRHLLRFWVDTDANTRPIAPTFAPRSSVQAKGGFKVSTRSLPLFSKV